MSPDTLGRRIDLGWWLCLRWRRAREVRGLPAVARQLRKQGMPLSVTLAVLGIKTASNTSPSPQQACGSAGG